MAICIPAFPSVWFQDAGVATSSSMEPSDECVCVCVCVRVLACLLFHVHFDG